MPYVPNRYPWRGEMLTIAEISARCGTTYSALASKMRDYNLTPEQATDPDCVVQKEEKWSLEKINLEACVFEYPEGMPLEVIADVWGVSRQNVHQLEMRALAKLRAMGMTADDMREYLRDAYRREPGYWETALDMADGGTPGASPHHGKEKQLSAEASEPSELSSRIDAAIAHLEVAADRALLAALSQVRLGES